MKRKRADRQPWPRILQRRFAMQFIDTEDFTGHVTLLSLDEVREPLWVTFATGERVCIVDKGYTWLQHFPQDAYHSMTTMFDAQGNIVQHYLDVCLHNGIDADGVPWFEDLFLDVIVMPSGESMVMDEEELDEALQNGVISQVLYDLAWRETRQLLDQIERDTFPLLGLCYLHLEDLSQLLMSHT